MTRAKMENGMIGHPNGRNGLHGDGVFSPGWLWRRTGNKRELSQRN